ncbi:uncharacterized protein UHOD_20839 [Ustilago sp. UG-2017b]|nr:uncharacterized protein UHOD_20567 [Ustilago sp. UG-2017b]SPC66716.1 uncharacterized protein UHOD_20839 [Ustilago sp. UG-2017b]
MSATITQPATTVPSTSTSTSASVSAPTQSHTDPFAASTKPEKAVQPPDISSPHQLIDWVDTVLGQLESRFDDMNGQVTSRMNEMSSRIDALESSIQATGNNNDA